jgi:hypothetical protein
MSSRNLAPGMRNFFKCPLNPNGPLKLFCLGLEIIEFFEQELVAVNATF